MLLYQPVFLGLDDSNANNIAIDLDRVGFKQENNFQGQHSSFIDSTGNLVTNGTYNYRYEGGYVIDTEIEVAADEDYLTGNEAFK